MKPRILTFNWHESYIHLLARTGCDFDVVEKWKGGRFGWIEEFRPVPPNCHLVSESEAITRLNAGAYDRVIAHNLNDLISVNQWSIPKILIFHNKLSSEIALGGNTINRDAYLENVRQLIASIRYLTLVFISKAKMEDWGMRGEIILPGVDTAEYNSWRGDVRKVLRVGNSLMERDIVLGYSVQDRLLKGLSSIVLGLNPNIADSYVPKSWEEFKNFMRSHRVYLNTTGHPYEDGYNLAMLESMATGMPVVSIANPSSPIEDNINGYVSSDEGYLRGRIEELLGNRSLAESLGRRARETVMDKFPIESFLRDWKRVIGEPVYNPVCSVEECKPDSKGKRLRILMSYTSNPQTTAFYLEKALRENHDVITYGPAIDDRTIKDWDLEQIRDRVKEHDIPYFTPDLEKVVRNLPAGWVPDLFLWVESGVSYSLFGTKKLRCPSVCYLIDTHLSLEKHLEIAKDYDFVFLAQREYLPQFKEAGFQLVYWLPLGCDPEIHKKRNVEKNYDIGFVGSLNQQRRIDLLNALKERFTLHYERCFLERTADVYSQSRIVFNNSVRNDLNMRVFEVLSSGSMLLTDEAKGSGLVEIFENKKHLVIYGDEKELFELADYYLKNNDERETIAAKGMVEVLSKHTYEHRTAEMIRIVSDSIRLKRQDRKARSSGLEDFSENSGLSNDNSQIDMQLTVDTGRKNNDYFRQERKDVEALIPDNALRILDVGCGEGILGRRLLEKGASEVVGVEFAPDVSKRAERNMTRVICGDIEKIDLPFDEGYFDCMVLADLLEHLRAPLSTLKKLRKHLSDSGVVVASIPNVRYHGIINMLVEGHWKYEDHGILDKTHLRFFTRKEIERLFAEAGFEITGITANIDPAYNSLSYPLSGEISFGRVSLRGLAPEELKDLFVFQYLLKAQKTGVEVQRLNDAVKTAIEAEKPDRARKVLEEYLDIHPADTDALFKYAEVSYNLGLSEEALRGLEKILLFEPERSDALLLRRKILNFVSAGRDL